MNEYRELLKAEYPFVLTKEVDDKWECWGTWADTQHPSPLSALLASDQPSEEAALKSAWRNHLEMGMQPNVPEKAGKPE